MGRLVKFVSRLRFVAKALVRVENADAVEKLQLISEGKQVALDALAHELGRASKAGMYWKMKASENNLMAVMLLASTKSGYVVVPKDRIDGVNYTYTIDAKEREDDVRFKLIETRRPKNVETAQDISVPVQRNEDAPSDGSVSKVQTPTNGSTVASRLAGGDVPAVSDAVGSDDGGDPDEEASQ